MAKPVSGELVCEALPDITIPITRSIIQIPIATAISRWISTIPITTEVSKAGAKRPKSQNPKEPTI